MVRVGDWRYHFPAQISIWLGNHRPTEKPELVYRLLNLLGFAAGQLAVFQARAKRPSSTILLLLLFGSLPTSVKMVLDGPSESGGRRTEKQPTGRGPEGCVENGPAAALLVGYISIQICALLAPCRRPIFNATKPKRFRRRCTRLTLQRKVFWGGSA